LLRDAGCRRDRIHAGLREAVPEEKVAYGSGDLLALGLPVKALGYQTPTAPTKMSELPKSRPNVLAEH
jgi:hypothetical protein